MGAKKVKGLSSLTLMLSLLSCGGSAMLKPTASSDAGSRDAPVNGAGGASSDGDDGASAGKDGIADGSFGGTAAADAGGIPDGGSDGSAAGRVGGAAGGGSSGNGGVGVGGSADGGEGGNQPNRICTLACCFDAFTATVRAGLVPFPAGVHVVDVTADTVTQSCMFTFPAERLTPGALIQQRCAPSLTISVEALCPAPNIVSCAPSLIKNVETIMVDGTPAQVHVRQTVSGNLILDQSATPAYVPFQPNGPGCDPICQEATAAWTLRN
jgi:hypothetical protein